MNDYSIRIVNSLQKSIPRIKRGLSRTCSIHLTHEMEKINS
jgi:hypothetical protein